MPYPDPQPQWDDTHDPRGCAPAASFLAFTLILTALTVLLWQATS